MQDTVDRRGTSLAVLCWSKFHLKVLFYSSIPCARGTRARLLTPRCSGWRWRCSARSSGTRFCGRICGEGRVATTPRPTVTTAAAATAATRAALPPPLLRTAAAARVGSAAASILSLVAAPPPAAPGRALEYPALRVKGPSTPLCGLRGRPVSGGGRVGRASSKLPCIVCLSMQSCP